MSRTVGVPWRHTRTRGDDRETMSEMDALDVFCARVANDEEPAWRLVVKMLRRADRPEGADEDASAAVRGIAASLIPIADALSERRREATAFRTASARAMNGATALEKVSRVEASAATTTARGVSFNSPRGKFDAHVMPNDDLVLENAKGAQIVVEAKSVRRVLVLETGDANRTSFVVVGLRGEGVEHGKSRLKTLCATFRAKDKLVMEGNGGGAMDDAARDENEHAAWTFYRALERAYGADACGTTDPARVFAGSKGLGHVQATKGFNSGHLFFLKEGVAFGPSPALYVHFDDLEDLRVLRAENSGSSTFDLSMTPENGAAIEFSNISREELEHVSRYLAKKCTSADDAPTNASANAGEAEDDEDDSDEDDEDFIGQESGSEDDDEEDDDDDEGDDNDDMEYSFDDSEEARGDAPRDAADSDEDDSDEDDSNKRRRVDASTDNAAPAPANEDDGSDSDSDDNAFQVVAK